MVKAILLDLDGTVYKGNKLLEGSREAIDNMRKTGAHVFFCTNNSSSHPVHIKDKLNNMGIDCNLDDIITAGMMAVKYVLEKNLHNVYISGTDDFRRCFEEKNILLCNEEAADVTVIGMDPLFNYEKMTKGLRAAVRSRNIIVCNEDRFFEKEDGIFPGNGGMTSAILYCSNRKPDVVVGKPEVLMPDYISKVYNYQNKDMIVVGDSVYSD